MSAGTTAVVLAGGKGSRMGGQVKKQYMQLNGRPLLAYCLETFENSPEVDDIILVCGEGDETWCREQIVRKYGFTKIRKITVGGKERYHSVWNGLKAAENCGIVMIHDGARPFVTESMLKRLLAGVQETGACIAAVPVKDTIKMADQDQLVEETLPRQKLWAVQTPQVFSYELAYQAYEKLLGAGESGEGRDDAALSGITDDAMVVELLGDARVKLVEGSYDNLKITTPEDLDLAEQILKKKN